MCNLRNEDLYLYVHVCVCACVCPSNSLLLFFFTDASTYAHYLFNAFDSGHNGSIKFEVILSVTLCTSLPLSLSHYPHSVC